MAKKTKKIDDESNPPLYVRTDKASRQAIDELVENVIETLTKKKSVGDSIPKRNEIIIKALHKGLIAYLKEIK